MSASRERATGRSLIESLKSAGGNRSRGGRRRIVFQERQRADAMFGSFLFPQMADAGEAERGALRVHTRGGEGRRIKNPPPEEGEIADVAIDLALRIRLPLLRLGHHFGDFVQAASAGIANFEDRVHANKAKQQIDQVIDQRRIGEAQVDLEGMFGGCGEDAAERIAVGKNGLNSHSLLIDSFPLARARLRGDESGLKWARARPLRPACARLKSILAAERTPRGESVASFFCKTNAMMSPIAAL